MNSKCKFFWFLIAEYVHHTSFSFRFESYVVLYVGLQIKHIEAVRKLEELQGI